VQESKYVFVFSEKNDAEIKQCLNASERCFLWLKLDQGSLAYSPEVVVALSAKRMTETLT
jgi:hypothetical protein